MDIKRSRTTPYHPACNSQVEVCNKFIAKYLGDFVDKNTLNWEVFLPAMAFAYNTSQHRSIKTTPFFLTFGMDHNTPHFKSTPDYGENGTLN